MGPERFQRLRAVLVRRQPDLTVLMDGVHKSHNFSAILRNCDAVGVLDAHVVPPERGFDLHHGSSAGATKWIGVHRHDSVTDAARHLRGGGFTLVAAHPSEDAVDFRDVDYTRPTAIVMGTELYGLSDEALSVADTLVFVPMLGMVHSLNVSVAAAILLFEAMRQRQGAGLYEESRLDPEAFERLLCEWAHPAVAELRRKEGRAYPRLDADGEIIREG